MEYNFVEYFHCHIKDFFKAKNICKVDAHTYLLNTLLFRQIICLSYK